MIQKRRDLIHKTIEDRGDVSLDELQALLPDVSLMTIRRDLIVLEKEGRVIRVRGGAKSRKTSALLQEPAYLQRLESHDSAKAIIASKAIEFVAAGRSLYIDSGTTCLAFTEQLPDDNIFIITPSPHVALEAAKRRDIRVNLTGGQLNRNTLTLSGTNAVQYMKGINIDVAFMAASAFSLQNGFSCGDFNEAELKRLIMRKAELVIVLMDQSKLGFSMPYTFARPNQVNILITEAELPEPYIRALRRAQVGLR
ncbi:MAG TPA: DeoR/GlpR transcriptional regulator [Fastidiosipila sp.]|jgi:DeoR family fructose operon transcriptional repressor|nr:DeoR/GlpR transcriptional regulator [Fastidiosipila sp.]